MLGKSPRDWAGEDGLSTESALGSNVAINNLLPDEDAWSEADSFTNGSSEYFDFAETYETGFRDAVNALTIRESIRVYDRESTANLN